MKKNEPKNFARIHKILLPKDYINYRLTGIHSSDYSDASGTLLLDVKNRRWSEQLCKICDVSAEQLPALYESFEVVGTLCAAAARELGLPQGVRVVAGAGDNAAAAVGTGTVGDGGCNLSLGTSGTLFVTSKRFCVDPNNALHAFAHADGGWHLMACMLSAASCNQWLCERILHTNNYEAEQAAVCDEALGRDPVFFLPYLMGERSPINDVAARGLFIGMTLGTERSDLVQAVLEGVAFAIRDSFEIARSIGVSIPRSKICGGGAQSPLWRKIIANVLGIPLDRVGTEQGPGYGAAILAMVGDGRFASVAAAAESLITVFDTTLPSAALTALYDERYEQYKKIYPTVKPLFTELHRTDGSQLTKV